MKSPETASPDSSERLAVAVPIAFVYGLLLYVMIWSGQYADAMPVIAGLMLLPMAVASLASSLSDPRAQKPVAACPYGMGYHRRACRYQHGLFHEAGICVAMAAPFFMVFSALGSTVTLWIIRQFRSRRTTTLVIALPLLVLPAELQMSYIPHDGAVTTVIEIAAPPEVVWQQTVEIRNVRPDELSWTFSHGILGVPQPVDARLNGTGVGAVRDLQWTHGVNFQEIVTQWEENRLLAWDFRFGPGSIPPEVEAHIKVDSTYLKLAQGDYRLEPLTNGHTRLTLTTHYQIATPIDFTVTCGANCSSMTSTALF